MKVYTKTGDEGQTGLLGSERVSKTSDVIEAIGQVDELNSILGWVAVVASGAIHDRLQRLQKLLFDLGGELAQSQETSRTIRSISATDIEELEQEIDLMDSNLPPLRNFILPGGAELAARLHIARSVCRRAERCVLRQHLQHPLRDELPTFLNRLSDWCFMAARQANQEAHIDDILWTQ